jgi:hypothetical protein
MTMRKLLFIFLILLPMGIFAQTAGEVFYVLKPCNMYSAASVKSEPVHLLNYNKTLKVKSVTNSWVEVEHYDSDGVRHTGYVQKANLTTDRERARQALQKSMNE